MCSLKPRNRCYRRGESASWVSYTFLFVLGNDSSVKEKQEVVESENNLFLVEINFLNEKKKKLLERL